MKVIGLMSGTSLDGVDLVTVEFSIVRKGVRYRLLKGKTIPYPDEFKLRLKNSRNLSGLELTVLDHDLGKFLGKIIKTYIKTDKIDLIASHGHTIFHQPDKGITLQIGSGAEIAVKTGIKTICDFRSTDVALCGEGAPLVPFGDELLFGKYDYCLNLGGFSNISFRKNKKRIAFDISPCNLLLNHLSSALGKEYDDKGKIASSGKVDAVLLKKLNQLKYYAQKTTKSLGVEWLEKEVIPHFQKSLISDQDKLATATEHIAIQISRTISKNKTVFVTGGGTYNLYLLGRISSISGCRPEIPDKNLINFKEALIFALLGYMRDKEWINTFSSSTGAKRDSSGGAIYFP